MGLRLGPSLCHFKSQWLRHVPPSATVKILCSVHRTYFCILYGSQKNFFFLCSRKWSGFHNRVRMCLLLGTSFILKYNSVYSWLKRSVACLSSRRPRFDPRSVHVRVVVEEVTLVWRFLRILLFSQSASFHISSILVLFYVLLLQEGQMGLAWEPSKKKCFSKIREQWIEAYCHIAC